MLKETGPGGTKQDPGEQGGVRLEPGLARGLRPGHGQAQRPLHLPPRASPLAPLPTALPTALALPPRAQPESPRWRRIPGVGRSAWVLDPLGSISS